LKREKEEGGEKGGKIGEREKRNDISWLHVRKGEGRKGTRYWSIFQVSENKRKKGRDTSVNVRRGKTGGGKPESHWSLTCHGERGGGERRITEGHSFTSII